MINKLKATNTYKHLISLTDAEIALKITLLLSEVGDIKRYEALPKEELIKVLEEIVLDSTYNYIRFELRNRYREAFIGTMDEAIEYATELIQQKYYEDNDEGYYQAKSHVKRFGICPALFNANPHYIFHLTFEEYGLHDLICFV